MEKKQTWFLIIKNFPYLAITIFFFYPGVTKKDFSFQYCYLLSRIMWRRKKNISFGILFDSALTSLSNHHKKFKAHGVEKWHSDLGIERVKLFSDTLETQHMTTHGMQPPHYTCH